MNLNKVYYGLLVLLGLFALSGVYFFLQGDYFTMALFFVGAAYNIGGLIIVEYTISMRKKFNEPDDLDEDYY